MSPGPPARRTIESCARVRPAKGQLCVSKTRMFAKIHANRSSVKASTLYDFCHAPLGVRLVPAATTTAHPLPPLARGDAALRCSSREVPIRATVRALGLDKALNPAQLPQDTGTTVSAVWTRTSSSVFRQSHACFISGHL